MIKSSVLKFQLVLLTEMLEVMRELCITTCDLGPSPFWLEKASRKILGPLLFPPVNTFLCFGKALVWPLFKKSLLAVDELGQLPSKLSFLIKNIEKSVARQFSELLYIADLLGLCQAGNRTDFGTGTLLIALMNDLLALHKD